MNPFHFITHQAIRDWEVSMSSRDVDTHVARFSSYLRGGLLSARRRLIWGS